MMNHGVITDDVTMRMVTQTNVSTLDYLKAKPRKPRNFCLVDAYGVWFVNYR